MSQRTADLTFKFSIKRQDDDGWPWDIELLSIEPKGTGNKGNQCGLCSGDPAFYAICDACMVEESIRNSGPDEWLKRAGIVVECDGSLTVKAFIEWWCFGTDDIEEEVRIIEVNMEQATQGESR